ncbi:MAG: hypothetical protein MK110_06550 [Fuerstiella sp.]|nr:hypothetical protein [Fuerstiella sp.]
MAHSKLDNGKGYRDGRFRCVKCPGPQFVEILKVIGLDEKKDFGGYRDDAVDGN